MEFIYKINQKITQYKYKIIYGSGISAIELYMKIAEQGGHIDFFCDKDPFVIGKEILNKKIIGPRSVSEWGDEACVIVCKEYVPEIIDELEKLGINNIFI